MVRGLQHFQAKNLSIRHMKVLLLTELCLRTLHAGRGTKEVDQNPTAINIASLGGVKVCDIERELDELVELRYLHETIPTFGAIVKRYKLGSMGGTVMRRMLKKAQNDVQPSA